MMEGTLCLEQHKSLLLGIIAHVLVQLILLDPMEEDSIRRLRCGAFRYQCSRGWLLALA